MRGVFIPGVTVEDFKSASEISVENLLRYGNLRNVELDAEEAKEVEDPKEKYLVLKKEAGDMVDIKKVIYAIEQHKKNVALAGGVNAPLYTLAHEHLIEYIETTKELGELY
jgi:hypothetical protein